MVEHRQEVSQWLTLFIVIKSSFLLSLFFFFTVNTSEINH